MKHLRYKSYKNSGIEWIGEIPQSWNIDRIKASIKSCKNGIWGDEPAGDANDTICVRVADFNRDNLSVDIESPTLRSVQDKDRISRALKTGDLLLEKSGGGENQPVGCVVLYNHDAPAVCSNFIARMSLKDGMYPAFWKYLHAAAYSIRLTIGSINQTSGIQNLDQDRYFNEKVPFPSLNEQKAIASFLDRETAKIDQLIQKQEKLIELLRLKRQAVIYKSVTKGLNTQASLSPSKITWIGEIPSHWVAGKVKNYFQVTLGKMLQPEQKRSTDRLVSYLRAANIQLSGVDISDVKEMWLSENELKELRLADGDILVSEGGDVGRCCIWNSELDECYFQNSINRVRPIGRQSNKFFYYWMTFAKNTGYIDILCNKSTIAHLTAEKLSALPMVFPPIKEQDAIVDFLDSMFVKFDALISKSELSISFLKEHRTSLISAAVTGKIDIRELI